MDTSKPRGRVGGRLRCPDRTCNGTLEARGRPEWTIISCTACASCWTPRGTPAVENPEPTRVHVRVRGRLLRDLDGIARRVGVALLSAGEIVRW